jgi:hypothetical protein
MKKSLHEQGTVDEWNILEKEVAKYDTADSNSVWPRYDTFLFCIPSF